MKDVFKIYDWTGREFECPIKGKIIEIKVRIISGDELVYIEYADGTGEHFDAGEDTHRLMDFYDGSYRLTDPDIIERWLNFDPAECKGKYPPEEGESYLRYDEFADLQKKERKRGGERMKGYVLCKEIPNRCVTCECYADINPDSLTGCPVCSHPVTGEDRHLPDEIYMMTKPNWCPIKPLPKRCNCSIPEDVNPRMVSWRAGWNACLEMLEGKEREEE